MVATWGQRLGQLLIISRQRSVRHLRAEVFVRSSLLDVPSIVIGRTQTTNQRAKRERAFIRGAEFEVKKSYG